jgi:LacI family transcriptional regulator
VDALCSRARLHGHQAALDKAELPVDPALVCHGNLSYEPAYQLTLELLDLQERPTAVFAGSDLQAFAVIEAARVRGLRVPEELSVVGFDDLPVARWAAPPLTTVRQPLTDMGRMALRILLRLVAGEALESHRIELATQLIERESTAPPARS